MNTSTDLAAFAADVTRANEDSPEEFFRTRLTALDFLKAALRETEAELKAKAVEWCQRNGRAIEVGGGVRYYAGTERETKCVDVPGALMALLEGVGGDFEKLATFLASQPIKHGASRSVLDVDTFAKCFATEEKVRLKEGRAVKSLLKADDRFAR